MERLKISENGRYFVKADGTPFTWLADTTWTLPQRMKYDDAKYLMEKRKSQGFTVLQVVALDPERDVQMRSPIGDKALTDDDLSKPNEAYFKYLDWIIQMAQSYGFYVLLLPVWGQLVVGDDWGGGTYEKTVTMDNAYGYGEFIGNRYKDQVNVLWCLGGDRQPIHKGVDYRPLWRKMAEGLAKGLTGKVISAATDDPVWKDLLITYHACHEMETGECSSLSYWDESEPWIRFVMIQSGHGLKPKNYEIIRKDYERSTVRPVWDGEPAYEMMPTCWPIDENATFHGTWIVRKRAYWSLLAGAFGHTYGHCSVWCSISEREKNAISKYSWVEALDSDASHQMPFLRGFMDGMKPMMALPVYDVAPDISENMDFHIQTAINMKEGWLCAYMPLGGTRTLNLEGYVDFVCEKKDQTYLWWWNPRDGYFYDAYQNKMDVPQLASILDGKLTVKAPTFGDEQDWMLILTKNWTKPPIIVERFYDVKKEEVKKVFEW